MGANAQTSVPTFAAGEVLTAANMNISARTGIPVFSTTTTRDAAFGGTGEKTLAEGQMCYIEAAPQRYQIYNGTAWKDFHVNYTDVSSTQTFGGFTKGNATVTSKYTRLGDFVHFYGGVVLGSTSSMVGPLDVTLPFGSGQSTYFFPTTTYFFDTSASILSPGFTVNIGTTVQRLVVIQTNTTYASNTDVTATVPFSWATGDAFYWNISYKAA